MINVEIVPTESLTVKDIAVWRAFLRQQPAFSNPLLDPDFARAVGNVRSDARVLIVRRGNEPVGFLAFHQRPGGLARPIGTPFSDYHAFVTGPNPGFTAQQALSAAGINAYRFTSLIDPYNLFEEAGAIETHPTIAIHLQGSVEQHQKEICSRSSKRFQNLRRRMRIAERDKGELTFNFASDSVEDFEFLLALKRDQLNRTGLHDFLGPLWVRQLLRQFFDTRVGEFRGAFATLSIGGKMACAYFGVRNEEHFHPWLAAYNPEFSDVSPGQIFLWKAIEEMPAAGLKRFDLGADDNSYKGPFTNETRQAGSGMIESAASVKKWRPRLRAAAAASIIAFAPAGLMARVGRRVDHIACVELSMSGRVAGIVNAFASVKKRAAVDVA